MNDYPPEELLTDTINEMESDDIDSKRQLELDLLYSALTTMDSDIVVKQLHYTFSEYSNDGVRYCIFDNADNDDTYKHIGAVILPKISKETVAEIGASKLDAEITILEREIFDKKEKKQQLLALENHSEETD